MNSLLELNNVSVKFPTRFGEFTALNGIDLTVHAGEIHGLVGESGAGKSTIGAAVMGLLQSPGYVSAGEILFQGENLRLLDDDAYHRVRGDRISMIFQDPQTSLNPLLTVSVQLIETIRQHNDMSVEDARERAVALLRETGIANVEERIDQYPHQFSGGMRQRVVIALAICTNPDLIIADEPTTALDVSVQKQILALIRRLCTERNIGIILITHDIGVINEVTDKVTVLRSGRVIESGLTGDVLARPQHEYTKALMAAVPRLDKRLDRFSNIVGNDELTNSDSSWVIDGASAQYATNWLLDGKQLLKSALPENAVTQKHADVKLDEQTDNRILSVTGLDVSFSAEGSDFFGGRWFGESRKFKALSHVDLAVQHGEVLGVVGESGSGKSTLAKVIVGLVNPTAGSMRFDGEALPIGRERARQHPARRRIQMIFQDPYSSLNNRQTVEQILAEPIRFYKLSANQTQTRQLVASVLDLVEMPQRAMLKYPHQFSGGQRQRIAVARAIVAKPDFLICDEPTSALDVSIQAQVLNLLKDLQSTLGLSILFISHNLAVIRQMSDRVAVLKGGELIETANVEDFFNNPQHAYSRQLLEETPSLAFG